MIPSRYFDNKESWNLSELEVHLVSPNQWKSHMLPFLDNSLNAKQTKRSILSRDINNHGILQSHWKRSKTGHTQQNVLVSVATFPK